MTPSSPNILVVDDDPRIREVISIALDDAGMKATEVSNGRRAVVEVQRLAPDLVILDVGMPEMDGFEACRTIRKSSTVPILFLTARDEEVSRVIGFELGADDYVCKPFSPRELTLRVRAILQRGRGDADVPSVTRHGALEMDPERHVCRLGESEIDLTGTEFALLHALARRPEQVQSRDGLIRAVYGDNAYLSDRTIDSHIRNVRAKAAKAGFDDVIATVHGVGVKLGRCRT